MNKKAGVIVALILVAATSFWGYRYFNSTSGAAQQTTIPEAPLAVGNNSDSFSLQINHIMELYYSMKDAFVKEDLTTANLGALTFSGALDELSFTDFKADSTLTLLATSIKSNIASESRKITVAGEWTDKRKNFQTASDLLFDFLRTVQYRGGKVYQQFCPMAFENQGANWLSNEAEIINPYFGEKMLHCGELKDSIHFSNQ